MLKIVAVFAVPAVVLFGGILMFQMAFPKLADREKYGKPLNVRWRYDEAAVESRWRKLGRDNLLGEERKALQLDLAFPLFYCGTFALAALAARAWFGWRFNPAWILAVLVVALAADWTENGILLHELQRHMVSGSTPGGGWIRAASAATAVKLFFVSVVFWVTLLVLAARAFFR